MESLTGPLLYMLIAWGVVFAVFLVLVLRRSLLASHEDDQIFLDAAEEHMAKEQRELVAKIEALSTEGPPLALHVSGVRRHASARRRLWRLLLA